MNEKFNILIQISLKFVPECPIDNKPVLVQVMARRWTGDKPLPEPVLTQFTNAYIDGLLQDCSNSIANAMELLQSCTKPSICGTRGRCPYSYKP